VNKPERRALKLIVRDALTKSIVRPSGAREVDNDGSHWFLRVESYLKIVRDRGNLVEMIG
jgi:hypothetical protein